MFGGADGLDCIEICGDGLNVKINPCDDGNLDNGDGCNELCEIEAGWACAGGDESNPDVCKDTEGPTASLIIGFDPTIVKFKFSKEMKKVSNM